MKTWTPRYDFADTAGALQGGTDVFIAFPYTPAPADSHLKEFRFVAASRMAPPVARLHEFTSYLHVVFKGTDTRPETEYEYRFWSEPQGRMFYDAMENHPDPGKVVWEMIRARVPYKPLR